MSEQQFSWFNIKEKNICKEPWVSQTTCLHPQPVLIDHLFKDLDTLTPFKHITIFQNFLSFLGFSDFMANVEPKFKARPVNSDLRVWIQDNHSHLSQFQTFTIPENAIIFSNKANFVLLFPIANNLSSIKFKYRCIYLFLRLEVHPVQRIKILACFQSFDKMTF